MPFRFLIALETLCLPESTRLRLLVYLGILLPG